MRRLVLLSMMAALALPALLHADNAKSADATLDPKVRDVLTQAATFYSAKKSVEVDILSETNISMTGVKQEMDSGFHLAIQQPNSIAFVMQSGMMGGTIVSDGKTEIIYQPILGKYTSSAAPATINDLLDPMNLVMVGGGAGPLGIENFFRKDPIDLFQQRLKSSKYLGLEKVGDVQANHLQVTSPPYVTDLWVQDGATPILLKSQTAIDMSDAFKKLPADTKAKLPAGISGMTMSRNVTFSNWKFDQPIAPDTFVFHPPLGAKLVDAFVPQTKSPLVGKPAPDFTLQDLDGRKVSLYALHGKVVVLDFWATWCGPCVETLPKVIKAASAFKDQGVVFYTVNLREKPDDIRKFQKDKSLNFPVLLDTDGKLADLYGARAIPQTVIIDKTGKIQVIHVGYDPSLDQKLTQQITDLLAGKTPAAPAEK